MTTSPSLITAPLHGLGRAGLSERFVAPPQGAPWGGATRSTGEFSNGTSGENYSGINTRKTGYKIFDRYKEHGLEALTDRSRRPVRFANQLPEQIEGLIVRLKAEKPHWG